MPGLQGWSIKRSIWICSAIIALVSPSYAYAKCSSPSAAAGGVDFQYSSAGSIENFCDDADTWKLLREVDDTGNGIRQLIQFADDAGSCTATKLGRIKYDDGGDAWYYCDGSSWQTLGGGGSGLWTDGAGDIIYYNSGSPQVGIGTAAPSNALDVVGKVEATGFISTGQAGNAPLSNVPSVLDDLSDVNAGSPNSDDVLTWDGAEWIAQAAGGGASAAGNTGEIQFNSGGVFFASSSLFWDSTNNRLGILDPTPDVELDVVGDIDYTGVITDVSDRRMKENIAPLENSLEGILALNGVSFTMKGDEKGAVEYGLIAQDVEPVFPELVNTKADGMKTLNYIGMIGPLVEATKAQQALIEAQRQTIDSLTARLDALEAAQAQKEE
jgi:hypothetical protein